MRYRITISRLTFYEFSDKNYDYWKSFAEFWSLEIETV
jgi:hypothetical protein